MTQQLWRKACTDSSSNGPWIPKMLRFTPGKPADADDIDAIITPPGKYESWVSIDTPSIADNVDQNGSFTEMARKPLGRFLSFDVKRSLFSGKRLCEQADDSPTTKRLREAESGISGINLGPLSPTTTETNNVKSVVHLLSTENDVIADGSRPHTLPTVSGKHSDLKSITPETMNDVLHGCYDDEIDHVTIIDCRYPYEYEGGHIKDAINLYTRTAIEEFLSRHSSSHASTKKHVVVFHCEFSSERGPKMYRHLRSEDRSVNSELYPRLNFPEIYLLEGGYKAFFYKFMAQCSPQTYKPMLHKDHAADLRHFRGKSKSWTAGERPQVTRTTLRF